MTANPFRFGVVAAQARSGEEWALKARRIESLGYAILGTPDGLRHTLAPLPALMAAAMATRSLRVTTYVIANDFRNPVLLAKEAATVDVLSGGRFELGIGVGRPAAAEDNQMLGIPPLRPDGPGPSRRGRHRMHDAGRAHLRGGARSAALAARSALRSWLWRLHQRRLGAGRGQPPGTGRRRKRLGLWSIASTLPVVIAPLIGSLVIAGVDAATRQTALGYRAVFALAAVCLLLGAGFVLKIQESRGAAIPAPYLPS